MTTTFEQRKELITAKVAEIAKLAEDRYGVILPNLAIRFDLRGKVIGQACVKNGQYSIRFNIDFVKSDSMFDRMLTEVAPHEFAHLVCFVAPALGKDHDKGWKRVCITLGGNGQRTMKLDVDHAQLLKVRNTTSYEYTATCGNTVVVTARRHTLIQRGKSYILTRTGGKINNSCNYVKV